MSDVRAVGNQAVNEVEAADAAADDAAAAADAAATFMVQVPDGVQAGQQIQVQTPAGQLVQVQVPPGLQPGNMFQIIAPAEPLAPAQPLPVAESLAQPLAEVHPVAAVAKPPPRAEKTVAKEIRKLFKKLDTDGEGSISEQEFIAGLDRFKASCDPKAVFAIFDVDGSGSVSVDELCRALAPELLAASEEGMSAQQALVQLVSGVFVAPERPEGMACNAKYTKTLNEPRTQGLVDEKELGCCDYFGATTIPCWLCCCSTHGKAFDRKPLVGLQEGLRYANQVKDCQVRYRWSQKTGYYTRKHGRRVSHESSKVGKLQCRDVSATFVPCQTKNHLALRSDFATFFTDVRLAMGSRRWPAARSLGGKGSRAWDTPPGLPSLAPFPRVSTGV